MKIGRLKFPPDLEEMEQVAQEDYDRFCANTIGKIEHAAKVVETQHAIIKHIEAMAQVMAEAGRASEKAMGDPAAKAIDKWIEILRKRAKELLKEPAQKQIEPPTIDHENP
jgi:Cu/Ag efflux pump CusA